jgi:hypothetical protein
MPECHFIHRMLFAVVSGTQWSNPPIISFLHSAGQLSPSQIAGSYVRRF